MATKTDTLPIVKADEQATLRTTVNGDIVTTVHTVKPDERAEARYNLEWSFDFAKVTRSELMQLAERNLRIKKQAEWRKDKSQMDAKKWHKVTFSVRDMLDNTRKAADPLQKASNLLDKMTAEERAALLKMLQGK